MVNIDLLGVVEDGVIPRAADIPPITVQPISITRNQDTTLRLTVRSAGGPLINLAGAVITWTMRRRSSDGGAILRLPGTFVPIYGLGRSNVVIAAARTKNIAAIRYVFDVWMQLGGVNTQIVPVSPALLLPGMLGNS